MRCCLVGTLIMKPDILLLDEPTNSLDAFGIEWLKKYLDNSNNFNGTLLFVSHDRNFMNSVADETIIFKNFFE